MKDSDRAALTILTIGSQDYVFMQPISNEDAVALLSILRGLIPVRYQSNYEQGPNRRSGFVMESDESVRIRLTLDESEELLTQDDWSKMLAELESPKTAQEAP